MKIEDIEITGLTSDSRLVKPGFLFAALDSEKAPGSSYIPSAIANGAALILGKAEYASVAGNVKFIADANPNKNLPNWPQNFTARSRRILPPLPEPTARPRLPILSARF